LVHYWRSLQYKRDNSLSVIDHEYAYLGLLLDNKPEFILLYNEKNKNRLRKEDVMGVKSKKEKEMTLWKINLQKIGSFFYLCPHKEKF
jgi:hypothetical protein